MMQDVKEERWLADEGVEAEYRANVSLDQFDQPKSLANQARLSQPVDPELVERYTRLIRAGVEFPALIAYLDTTGKLVLIGGNHRLLAYAAAKVTGIDVYVVKTTDRLVIDRLTRAHNTTNGKAQTPEEDLQHALYLVEHAGYSATQAAKIMNVRQTTLKASLRIREVRRTLEAAEVNPRQAGLSAPMLEMLASVKNRTLLLAIAARTRGAGLRLQDVQALVRALTDVPSEAEGLQIISTFFEAPEILALRARTGRCGTPRLPVTDVFRSLSTILNLFEKYPSLTQLGLTTPEEIARAEALLSRIQTAFTTLTARAAA